MNYNSNSNACRVLIISMSVKSHDIFFSSSATTEYTDGIATDISCTNH